MSPYFAEMLGTAVMIIFGVGVHANTVLKKTKFHNAGPVFIITTWAFGIAIASYLVGGISGCHLNPSVTIAFACIGRFPWSKVPGYIIAQFIGAVLGSIFAWILYYPHWEASKDIDPVERLSIFCTTPAIRNYKYNFICEFLATFMLILGILGIGVNKLTNGVEPFAVAILIWVLGMGLGGPTGFAMNAARDIGPRFAHFILPLPGKGDSDWKYAFVPGIAPILGSITGAFFFVTFFK